MQHHNFTYRQPAENNQRKLDAGARCAEYRIACMSLRKALGAGVKILVTLLLLFLIFRSVDTSRIAHNLREIESSHLILLVVICWGGQLLCAQRWRLFADSLGMQGTYRGFAQMYLVGMLFNIGLPSLIGGDVVKAYILSRRSSRPLQSGLASVLQDRAAGLVSLIVYGTAAVLITPITWRGIPLSLIYLVFWLGLIVALWLVWKGEGVYRRFMAGETVSPLQKIVHLVADFHQALVTMKLGWGAVVQFVASFLWPGRFEIQYPQFVIPGEAARIHRLWRSGI